MSGTYGHMVTIINIHNIKPQNSMYTDILTKLDLTKNEAKIYETLLKHGETTVAKISGEAQINRRNVYDSLSRLIEKGLIFEIRQGKENLYQAVDPKKLMESIKEKEIALESIMPALQDLYISTPHHEDVYVYRGVEGWKNVMRDILRVGKDVDIIGGKGAWADPKIAGYSQQFFAQAKKKGIKFRTLYDIEVEKEQRNILKIFETEYRFLPEGYSSTGAMEIFGDYITLLPLTSGNIDESSFTVVVNKRMADAFRVWFKLMWNSCSEPKKKK